MKSRAMLAALCVVALFARTGHASPPASTTTAGSTDRELRAVGEAWRAHYNAKDAAAVAALYAEDAYYVSAHVVAHGRVQIQAYFQRGIDAGGHIDSIDLLASGRSGELAYWVGTYEATNAGQKVRGRNVVVARRVGGQWLMVAHESVVADQP